MKLAARSGVSVIGLLAAQSAFATFLPPNNLHLQDRFENSNMTEVEFNAIVDKVINTYKPIVKAHGGTLVSEKNWGDSTVNAYADRAGTTWTVAMFGGLARRPEITSDGFAMVVCHELGHHLAGYYFYSDNDWAASEGQSDYFATHACARKIWGNEATINATYRAKSTGIAKQECDKAWSTTADQDLCYRATESGKSLAILLAALNNEGVPKYDTPDTTQVNETATSHPEGQCRLDTYFQAALCPVKFDETIIPGLDMSSAQNSPAAEKLAGKYTCLESAFSKGFRPHCWFKPQTTDNTPPIPGDDTIAGASNNAISIPDGDTKGIISTINVTKAAVLKSVAVKLDITHPYIGDLKITLITPSGQKIVLANKEGGSADNIKTTITKTVNISKTIGNWKLVVADLDDYDSGTLNSWSLIFPK